MILDEPAHDPEKTDVQEFPNPAYNRMPPGTYVGPVLLERVCDAERPTITVEEMQERLQGSPWRFGCGTRFRWYLHATCVCPGCGHTYQYTHEMLAAKKYVISGLEPVKPQFDFQQRKVSEPCMDCVDGYCTMNCGPAMPPKK